MAKQPTLRSSLWRSPSPVSHTSAPLIHSILSRVSTNDKTNSGWTWMHLYMPSHHRFSYTNDSRTLGLQTAFLYTAVPTMDSAPMILEDKQKFEVGAGAYNCLPRRSHDEPQDRNEIKVSSLKYRPINYVAAHFTWSSDLFFSHMALDVTSFTFIISSVSDGIEVHYLTKSSTAECGRAGAAPGTCAIATCRLCKQWFDFKLRRNVFH